MDFLREKITLTVSMNSENSKTANVDVGLSWNGTCISRLHQCYDGKIVWFLGE